MSDWDRCHECGERFVAADAKAVGRCPKCGERYPAVPKNHSRPELIRRLRRLGPECESFREAILTRDVAFGHEMLDLYDAASEDDKADQRAFCDSNGPKKIHDLRTKHEDGTPTSADLEGWAE